MKKHVTKTWIIALFTLAITQLQAQTDTTKAKTTEGGQTPVAKAQDSLQSGTIASATAPTVAAPKPGNSLNISVDMRTRAEFRHGYKGIPLKDTTPAFFVNQRTRLNFDFKTKRLDFYASIQDARVWGQQDPREGQGTTSGTSTSPGTTFPIYLFEAYVEPHFNDRWSVRIGRQRIVYDNQRLFAENDWRLPGNSHDAVRFIYNNKINLNTELLFAFNQSAENTFTSAYAPNVKNYKDLLVHYLNYKLSKSFILTTINTMDGYQSAYDYKTTYQRFTSGGRLEYQSYNWYATVAAYYQYGKDSSGKKLAAYYLQPELKYSSKTLAIRLGMEYLSGQDSTSSKDNNFVPLYGVAHRFMGNMDFFSSFPGDVKSGGLINPYLFFQYQKNKWTLRFENHLFYSHTGFAFKGMPANNKFLGYENDWRVNFKPTSVIDIEYGFCWAAITNSMIEVKSAVKTTSDFSNYSKTPYWTYLSVRFTPVIGKFTF
jgi:hypothetical protein